MSDPVVQAFMKFHDLAINIAGECDALQDAQQEAAIFADRLREYVGRLQGIMETAVQQNNEYYLVIPAETYEQMRSEFREIQAAVGIEESQPTEVEHLPVKRLFAR